MANSKYEYVKSFEVDDEVFRPNLIVIRIQACEFRRNLTQNLDITPIRNTVTSRTTLFKPYMFSDTYEFDKPNDEIAVNLMNSCATAILEAYPDIVFGFGFSDDFVLKSESTFYERRASKILSLLVSFFTSVYVTKWIEYFPEKKLRYTPSFQSQVIVCASTEVLQAYLSWRQNECHDKNLYETCLSLLVKSGQAEKEADKILKDSKKQEKHELLFQFGINYKNLPLMFRQGSCLVKTKEEKTVKYNDNGIDIRRLQKSIQTVHAENIATQSFCKKHLLLVKEPDSFQTDIHTVKPAYIKSFLFEEKLIPSTWIVVRIDGCHFHEFSKVHEFEKPNDEQALNLMNSCAMAVMNEFQEITFSYGVSDEYSFVLKKETQFYQRRKSAIVSAIVSFFSSVYTMNWKRFFPNKELKYPPHFDGRAICYPSEEIVRDYLAWRYVDCHINNQFNTCFWMLVKSGKSNREAQARLKGTQTEQKYELLANQFGIDYFNLPIMFRHGSSVFWDMNDTTVEQIDSPRKRKEELEDETMASNHNFRKKLVVEHCDIIEQNFWDAHQHILLDERLQLR